MVITLTSLSIVPAAWAAEWVEIDKNAEDGINYVDKDSLQKKGNSVLFSAKTVLRDAAGKLVRDIEGNLSADCDSKSYQVLAGKNLITGETFNTGDKAPVRKAEPSSITAKLIDYACTGK
jgi:phage gp45-like